MPYKRQLIFAIYLSSWDSAFTFYVKSNIEQGVMNVE